MKRRWDYDQIRVWSMCAVVLLHTAAGTLRSASGVLWHVANVLTSVATAAVPLFFMLSGALLLSGQGGTEPKQLLRRRLPRLLVPALVWSLLSLLCLGLMHGKEAALGGLKRILQAPVIIPYWFLYAIVTIYLVSPLVKTMTDHLSERQWRYLLALWGICCLGLNTCRALLPAAWQPFFRLNEVYGPNFVAGYLGYFLLGGWLARRDWKLSRPLLWRVTLIDTALIAAGTLWASRQTGAYDERFKSYLGLFTAVLAVALFLLFRAYGREKTSGRGVTMLASLSFGVYLAHPMALELWKRVCRGGLDSSLLVLAEIYLLTLLSSLVGTLLAASIKPLCFPLTGQHFAAACREGNLFALRHRTER